MKAWALRIAISLVGLVVLLVVIVTALYAYLSSQTNGEILSGGEKRRFLLHVPANYDPSTPAPLVISLHGAYLYPGFQMRLTHWNVLADIQGFIVVYPKAAGLPGVWRMTPEAELEIEVQFFSDLIDKLSESYNIDASRIYANGFSNGAAMTFMLSCTLPDRIAAFGMVATPVVPWEWCPRDEPAPLIAIHGTEDPFAPYEGGENFLTTEPLLSMREWASRAAQRNACKLESSTAEPEAIIDVRRYTDCADNAVVELHTIRGAGHVWPGGMTFPGSFAGSNSASMDATEQLWQFFSEHRVAP